jgi:hypothetical protein
MSTFASTLSGIARSKLHLAVGGGVKDNCSLHRWVLLKNSLVRSQPCSPYTTENSTFGVDALPVHTNSIQDEDVEEECDIEEDDGFVFPDPGVLPDTASSSKASDSEAQWLDSLLETLSEDMGDDTHPHDDDEVFYSPSLSPISSSEDLVHTPNFVSYPLSPYPPLFHPPLILPEDLEYSLEGVQETQVMVGFPYYDVDDLDDLSVPEAIEDTSDDESEVLHTPYSHSTTSFPVDPASIPLPPDTRQPHVYIDTNDSYLYHFERDPLPFAGDSREYASAVYQEC